MKNPIFKNLKPLKQNKHRINESTKTKNRKSKQNEAISLIKKF